MHLFIDRTREKQLSHAQSNQGFLLFVHKNLAQFQFLKLYIKFQNSDLRSWSQNRNLYVIILFWIKSFGKTVKSIFENFVKSAVIVLARG